MGCTNLKLKEPKIETLLKHQSREEKEKFEAIVIGGLQKNTGAKALGVATKRNSSLIVNKDTLNKDKSKEKGCWRKFGVFFKQKNKNSKPTAADTEKRSEVYKHKKTESGGKPTEPEKRNDINVIPVPTTKKTDPEDIPSFSKQRNKNRKPNTEDTIKESEAHKGEKTENRGKTTELDKTNGITLIKASTHKNINAENIATEREVEASMSSIRFPTPPILAKSELMHISANKYKDKASFTYSLVSVIDIPPEKLEDDNSRWDSSKTNIKTAVSRSPFSKRNRIIKEKRTESVNIGTIKNSSKCISVQIHTGMQTDAPLIENVSVPQLARPILIQKSQPTLMDVGTQTEETKTISLLVHASTQTGEILVENESIPPPPPPPSNFKRKSRSKTKTKIIRRVRSTDSRQASSQDQMMEELKAKLKRRSKSFQE